MDLCRVMQSAGQCLLLPEASNYQVRSAPVVQDSGMQPKQRLPPTFCTACQAIVLLPKRAAILL